MNIFYLDTNVIKCAQYHCDKHVVKMVLESVQLLSAVLHSKNMEAPYKLTHQNHPCAVWARKHNGNYTYLWDLAHALGNEYTHRYGKVHKSHQLLLDGVVPRLLDDKPLIRSPLPNCTNISSLTGEHTLVDIYRMYYIHTKKDILTYNKNREEPEWMGDRFYQQQHKVTIGALPQVRTSTAKSSSKMTKEQMADRVGCPALKKLLVKDLELLAISGLPDLSGLARPEPGRLKKPFKDFCSDNISDQVDWGKLTIAELTEVINNCI